MRARLRLFQFENKIVGGVIPKEFIAPIDQGIREAAQSGVLGGYEVVDFKATLVRRLLPRCGLLRNGVQDRRLHGLQGGAGQGGLRCLLEPMMKIEVVVPEAVHGRRDGRYLQPPRPRRPAWTCHAWVSTPSHGLVPLSEMFGYATDLRSQAPRAAATVHHAVCPLRGSSQALPNRSPARSNPNQAASLNIDSTNPTDIKEETKHGEGEI